MKARLPTQPKTRVSEFATEASQTIYRMIVLLTLRRMGWGNKKISEFCCLCDEISEDVDNEARIGDGGKKEFTNLNAAVVKLIGELDGIDWMNMLNVKSIFGMNRKDIIKIADISGKMKKTKKFEEGKDEA